MDRKASTGPDLDSGDLSTPANGCFVILIRASQGVLERRSAPRHHPCNIAQACDDKHGADWLAVEKVLQS